MGKRNITHLFNAMSGISHKTPGLAMLPFLDSDIYFELNSDGVHLDPEIIKMCYKNLNNNRLILITDAVVSAGIAHGTYQYYGNPIESGRRGVRYKENDILIGSNCLITNVVQNFIKITGAPIEQAVRFATYNPCQLLGIEHRKGSIEIGKEADLIIFDNDFNLIKNFNQYNN